MFYYGYWTISPVDGGPGFLVILEFTEEDVNWFQSPDLPWRIPYLIYQGFEVVGLKTTWGCKENCRAALENLVILNEQDEREWK